MLKILFIMLIFTLFSCNNEDKIKNESIKKDINKEKKIIDKQFTFELKIKEVTDLEVGYNFVFESIDNRDIKNEEVLNAVLNNKIKSITLELYKNLNTKEKIIYKESLPLNIMYYDENKYDINLHKGEFIHKNIIPLNTITYNYEFIFEIGHANKDIYKIGREYKVLNINQFKVLIPEEYTNSDLYPMVYDEYMLNLDDIVYDGTVKKYLNKNVKLQFRLNIDYFTEI